MYSSKVHYKRQPLALVYNRTYGKKLKGMILIHKAHTNESLDLDDTSGQLQLKCSLHFVFLIFYTLCIEDGPFYWQLAILSKNYTGYWKGVSFYGPCLTHRAGRLHQDVLLMLPNINVFSIGIATNLNFHIEVLDDMKMTLLA